MNAIRLAKIAFCLVGISILGGCEIAADAGRSHVESTATTQPAPDAAWPEIAKILERPGAVENGVYVVRVPRDDLDVAIGGMAIPTAAGIESVFYFYRCPCGKLNVAGHFVTADYESNDVVDALRQQAVMRVAAITPMLQYDNPRLMAVYFQGEGNAADLAKNIREAIRWTGHERMAPQKMEDGPQKGK